MPFPDETHVEELFDIGIYEKSLGDFRFKTRTLKNDGGYIGGIESQWDRSKTRFQIGERTLTTAELDYIRSFFMARRGKAVSFLWRDYHDFSVISAPLLSGFAGNTQSTYQANREYQDWAGFFYRVPIARFIPGTLVVYRDGIAIPPNQSSALSYTIGSSGQIVFNSPPQSGEYTIDCHFYKIVRFDSDRINVRFDAYDPYSEQALYFCSDLQLTELRSDFPSFPTMTAQGSESSVPCRLNFKVHFADGSSRNVTGAGWLGSATEIGSNPTAKGYDLFIPLLGIYIQIDQTSNNGNPPYSASPWIKVICKTSPTSAIETKNLYYNGTNGNGFPSLISDPAFAPTRITDIQTVSNMTP